MGEEVEMSKALGRRGRTMALVLGLMLPAVLTVATDAGQVGRKMKKEIRIAEELVNEVLVESPNWLVRSGGPASAVYIDGVGLLVSFDASLVGGGLHLHRKGVGILSEILGHDLMIWDDDEEELDDEKLSEWKEKSEERSAQRYSRGKVELRRAMVDVADFVDGLTDAEWVIMAVDLQDHSHFRKNDLSKLTFKAKVGDLRGLASGKSTPEQMAQRIVESEY